MALSGWLIWCVCCCCAYRLCFGFYGADGKAVAVARTIPDEDKSSIRVLDLASGEQHSALTILASPVRRLAYFNRSLAAHESPMWRVRDDGKLVVLAGIKPGRLYLFEGDKVTGLDDTVASPSFVGIGANDNHLVVMNEIGDLRSHDAQNARPFGPARSVHPAGFVKTAQLRFALRPRGLGVAVSDGRKEGVYLWSEDPPKAPFEECSGIVECMASDAEGLLAVATTERYIFFARPDGDITSPYQGPKADVKQMAFSADGKRLAIAYADGTLLILGFEPPRPEVLRINGKVEPGKWAELLTIPVSGVRGLEFGPDGKTLAAASAKGVVVLGASAKAGCRCTSASPAR